MRAYIYIHTYVQVLTYTLHARNKALEMGVRVLTYIHTYIPMDELGLVRTKYIRMIHTYMHSARN